MGKVFSKNFGEVPEVEDYGDFVLKRPSMSKPVSVVYNPFTNATPIWLWSYNNRPSLLTTNDVRNITILSSQHRGFAKTEHSSGDICSSDVYDCPHEMQQTTAGLWIFSVRDCCDSVDCIWRRLAFTFLDGTLSLYCDQIQITPANTQKDGWHVLRVYMHSTHEVAHMLACEEVIRQRGVRSTMLFFSSAEEVCPSYISCYREDDGLVSVAAYRRESVGRKLKEYQSRPLPMRHRCSNCIQPVSHNTIEEM